ncbi:unnamed protein product [Kuraishia capsulata CBS 1993]|uniref:Uncharacterized protein n=1 Tax=Kuraishia capsulata CBS 1993 TaxID=1382522 RepID=W6MU07_9ASCO|nr:uncharacterized protein KUCA_T00001329001 [Kuraishia capsulata CBS 1993]CDK25360.1 unnamed protein product [Kuraishia capsulata CBS 1993]
MATRISNADKENASIGVRGKGLGVDVRQKQHNLVESHPSKTFHLHKTPLKAQKPNGQKKSILDGNFKGLKSQHGLFDDSLEFGGASLLFTSAKKPAASADLFGLHRGRKITVQKDSPLFSSRRKELVMSSPELETVPKVNLISKLAEVEQDESDDSLELDLPSSKRLEEMEEIPDGYEPFDKDLLFKLYAPGQQVRFVEDMISEDDETEKLEAALKVEFDDLKFDLSFSEEEEVAPGVHQVTPGLRSRPRRFMASTSSSRHKIVGKSQRTRR